MGKGRDFKKRNCNRNKNPKFNNKPSSFMYKKSNNQHRKRDFNKDHKQNIVFVNLREDQVGITEYVGQGAGFTGVIKARFSDFHVNEIDLDGNEVKLTDLKVPVAKDDSLGKELLEKNKKELDTIITEEIWEKIRNLLKDRKVDKSTSIDIDVSELDKDKRTLIHKTLKEEFGSDLISTTATIEEKKFIQCFRSKGNADQDRNKWVWPGEYVYFVVHKENTDSVRAASDLAKSLRLRPSAVNYAGTKDKRAKTSQLFCVKKREPHHIMRAARELRYMRIGNFDFKDNVLKLGNLKGNRFRVVVRHVEGDDVQIERSLGSIRDNGFINYYGLQRFGNSAGIPTYDVGIALLKGDYKEASELILKPRDGDQYFIKEIREFWWKTRNSAEAAAKFYDDRFIEKKLLDGLAHFGENDYANALRRIPRNMLLLYTHSYQSLIWNQVASRRIKEFGLKLIPGDLVYNESVGNGLQNCFDPLDVENGSECDDDETEGAAEEEIEKLTPSEYKTMVKPLTDEDIASGKYTIFDVVLPLPGHDITYPANEIAKWYEEILAEKELSSEKLKHNVKTYSLAGAYRKLITKPENMKWEFKRYNSPTSTLVASDIEDLKSIKADSNIPDGRFKSLILDFTLPSSAYATMALREILKADTSAASQQKLTEEINNKNKKENDETENTCRNKIKLEPTKDVTKANVKLEPNEEEGESKKFEVDATEEIKISVKTENSNEVEADSSIKRKLGDQSETDNKKIKVE